MLSILCIVITLWIIVRYRTCSKHDSGHVTRNTTSPIPNQSATCNLDLHEMQNLIAKTETLAPNGLVRHTGNSVVSERIMLNSSTPKKPRNDDDFSCVIKAKDEEFNPNQKQLHFPAGVETNQSNGATCVDDSSAVLPQNVHSNVKTLFPATPPNGNLKAPSNPQVSFFFFLGCYFFNTGNILNKRATAPWRGLHAFNKVPGRESKLEIFF